MGRGGRPQPAVGPQHGLRRGEPTPRSGDPRGIGLDLSVLRRRWRKRHRHRASGFHTHRRLKRCLLTASASPRSSAAMMTFRAIRTGRKASAGIGRCLRTWHLQVARKGCGFFANRGCLLQSPLRRSAGSPGSHLWTSVAGLTSAELMVQRCIGSFPMRTVPICCSGSASTTGSIYRKPSRWRSTGAADVIPEGGSFELIRQAARQYRCIPAEIEDPARGPAFAGMTEGSEIPPLGIIRRPPTQTIGTLERLAGRAPRWRSIDAWFHRCTAAAGKPCATAVAKAARPSETAARQSRRRNPMHRCAGRRRRGLAQACAKTPCTCTEARAFARPATNEATAPGGHKPPHPGTARTHPSTYGFFVPRNCSRIGVPGSSNASRRLLTR